MKRLFFTFLWMLCASMFISTQAADTFIAGFEAGETGYDTEGWYTGYTMEIVDNTDASGINNSDKCLMATITAANPDRWGLWVHVNLTTPVTITADNRYFKVMVKRSPNNTSMALSVDEEPWGMNYYLGQAKPNVSGIWKDIVFDLFSSDLEKTCENKQVQKFAICLGTWDGCEAGVSMLDNIVLSDNNKPRGANEVNPGLLANFDNETLTTQNWAGFSVQSAQASYQIGNNTVKSDVNPSDKSLIYNKPANTTWWHALICSVKDIIPVTYPKIYFHTMMYIPDATPTTILVLSPSGKEKKETIYPMDGEGWYDYVVDVSELSYISQVSFRFNQTQEDNWENLAETYYVDDFVLNDNPDARETITTGIDKNTVGNVSVYAKDGHAYISAPDLKSATIYAANGQVIAKQTASGSTIECPLLKGIYIVKVESGDGRVSGYKLFVK